MSFSLDYQLLLRTDAPSCAKYLLNLVRTHGEEPVSRQLLDAIAVEQLPPAIAHIWLSVAHTPVPIKDALHQDHSAFTRQSAIVRVSKYLKGKEWRKLWDVLGGTPGLASLFAKFSTDHVRKLARAIGSSSRKARDTQRESAVTELFECLFSRFFPHAAYVNPDDRPLQEHYMCILPGCSDSAVISALKTLHFLPVRRIPAIRLLSSHTTLLQDLARKTLHGSFELNAELFHPLLSNVPSSPSSDPEYSAPMLFAFSLISDLVENGGDEEALPETVISVLRTLLQKAVKRRVSRDSLKAITRLCVEYFKTNPKRQQQLSIGEEILLKMNQIWSRTGDEDFKSSLIALLQMLPDRLSVTFEDCEAYLRDVKRPNRYEMLMELSKEVMDIDFECDQALLHERFNRLSTDFFLLLQPVHARSLLSRLMHMRPDCAFVRLSDEQGVLRTSELGESHADCNMLHTYLHQGDKTAKNLALAAVSELRSRTQKEKDQPTRAFLAKSLISYAILSGSIDVFKDNLAWTRRFLRDHFTAREIYDGSVIGNSSAVSLISGMPKSKDVATWRLSWTSIRESVEAGNSVLALLFEIVLEAFCEPSFQHYHWHGVFNLFKLVVQTRANGILVLQEKLKFSDEGAYNLVWSSTLATLIDIERRALAPEFETLGQFNEPQGLLRGLALPFARQAESTLRFVDSLARARDDIWQNHRRSAYSSVAILPKPLSKGLPLQWLVPEDFDHNKAGWTSPALEFLADRALTVVFMDQSDALAPMPKDGDAPEAIGSFVDDYNLALRFYIFGVSKPRLQQDRLESAFSHAVNWLCNRTILSEREASVFWSNFFRHIIPGFKPSSVQANIREMMFCPRLPVENDASQLTEWNPEAERPRQPEAKKVPYTQIHHFLNGIRPCAINDKHAFLDYVIIDTPRRHPSIWNLDPSNACKRLPGEVQDGHILSALLYLDSKKLAKTPELASPFPSTERVRFPALYLDGAFLDSDTANVRDALMVLKHLLHRVPPGLVAALCRTELGVLSSLQASSGEIAMTRRIAFGLVRLLRSSDRPSHAFDLATHVILDHPEASSWHRQLLTSCFLRRLPASDAQEKIRSLVDTVLARLSDQSQRAEKRKADDWGDDGTLKPFVKVTTVKLIAQILSDSDFVPLQFSTEVLGSIFKHTKHVDIRAAVIDTLLNMLLYVDDDDHSSELAERIFSALALSVPVISQFNEAEPMTEEEWRDAERLVTVPEPFGRSGLEIPPIMSTFIEAEVPKQYKRSMVDRIFLPAMALSQRNNRRWLEIVVTKHKADPKLTSLAGPFTPGVIAGVLKSYYDHLPASTYFEHQRWIMSNLSPSSSAVSLSSYFKSSHELNKLCEARRWLDLYHNPKRAASGGSPPYYFTFDSLIYKEWRALERSDAITRQKVQDIVVEQALALVDWPDGAEYPSMHKVMDRIRPPVSDGGSNRGSLDDRKGWDTNTRPVIKRIMGGVHSIRTPQWQRNSNRKPRMLPDTFQWRLWLLPHPDLCSDALDVPCCHEYGQAIKRILEDGLKHGGTYHAQLQDIKKAVMSARRENQMHIAHYLGSGGEFPDASRDSVLYFLCVEIAYETVKPHVPELSGRAWADDGDIAEARQKLWDMISEWSNSRLEEVRVKGILLMDNFPG